MRNVLYASGAGIIIHHMYPAEKCVDRRKTSVIQVSISPIFWVSSIRTNQYTQPDKKEELKMKFRDYIDMQLKKSLRPVLMLNCGMHEIIVNNRKISPGDTYIQSAADVENYADQNQVFIRYV